MNKGRIRISGQLYNENYDLIKPIFELVKPVKIDIEYWSHGDVVVWGESKHFDEVEKGTVIPFYIAVIAENGVTFEKT